MVIKKAELYGAIWSDSDDLRGGIEGGHYQEFVLSLPFIKHMRDKYAGVPYATDQLTRPTGIFENAAIDFSNNRAEGDDILCDACEHLTRHFATEGGKSQGYFYTPAEASRVIAGVIGRSTTRPTSETTVCDPTCGSSSLRLKVHDEAEAKGLPPRAGEGSAISDLACLNLICMTTREHRSSSRPSKVARSNTEPADCTDL
jgi:type I restriction-modification system DNA methylase subunit